MLTFLLYLRGVYLDRQTTHPILLFYWIVKKIAGTFPELKEIAHREYSYWETDMVLIEAKASGTPLTQELRRMGIPVVNYSPTRGHDKTTRMHSVAPVFEAGMVYAPEAYVC